MITFIVAPQTAPQIDPLALAGVRHPLAAKLMDAMRQRGTTSVAFWKIIDALANAEHPQYRAHRRYWRLRFWGACRELLRAGLLFRHGKHIATSKFATIPKPRKRNRGASRPSQGELLSPTVGESTSENDGSSPALPMVEKAINLNQTLGDQLVGSSKSVATSAPENKSATPSASEISAAASALARRPRKVKRVLSGWLHGQRTTRLMPVIVPGGRVLPSYFVRRGFVFVLLPDEPEFEGRIFERYRGEDVRIYRSPDAALLGGLPPRPGSRPRGRPRKSLIW